MSPMAESNHTRLPPAAPDPASPRVRGQRELQRTGTLIAGGLGVVFLGVLGWYMMHARGASAPAPVAPPGPKARANTPLGNADPGELQLAGGEGVQIDLMDKKDLRRQTGLLKFDSLEPLEARHFAAAKPEAWLYLNDGRTLHITAASGKLYMPDRDKEPESGTLSGGVVAELYGAHEDGAKVQVGTDSPSLTFKTQTLAFDSTLGKMSTPDRVTVVSTAADFTGSGMEVLFNQVGQRLELCKIGAGDNSAVFHTGGKAKKSKKPASPVKPATGIAAGTSPAGAPVAQAPAPKTPVETLYQMDFDQAVGVAQGTRTLNADKLRVWARLVDGDLPEGAIAQVKGQADTRPAEPVPSGPASNPVVVAGGPPAVAADTGGDITLRWTGPCEIAPLAQTPPELKDNHVAARFTAEQSRGVRLGDSERGASGRSGMIEYLATTGKLLLAGSGAGRPKLEWPNAGMIETDRIEGDLTHGLIHIPVAGVLHHAGRDAEARWGEQADFSLVVRDGALVGELKQATFSGGFSISDANTTLSGGFARADFSSTADQPNNLVRLIVNEKAVAHSERSGRIGADTLDVEFALPPPGQKEGDPVPRIMTAAGHVVVDRKDSRLTTEWLEAHLGRMPSGSIDVSSATARGLVRISRESDALLALADEMRTDLSWTGASGAGGTGAVAERRQTVDLLGSKVVITRGERSKLTGTQVRLDGAAHRVEVFGTGAFDHNEPDKAVVVATWTGGMSFDDDAGRLECSGGAHAVSTPDALTRDEIEAERIVLALTPREHGTELGGEKEPERKLLRADATGSVLEREGGVNAKVTSERFTLDPSEPGGRRREQLQYLEGPRILADNERGTLDVPGAGTLAIADRKATESPETPGPSSLSRTGSRGDSLVNWAISLHMDRDSGRADMHGTVRLTHRSLRDRQITNMDCEHLITVVKVTGTAPSAQGANLVSATATGAVYATVGPEATPRLPRPARKELVADKVEYDALKGTLDAAASSGSKVSLFDPARGAPVNAERLFWDLARDRIEVRNLEPVVGPK